MLVGKSAENTTTVGIQARADGLFTAVKASAESAIFGRNTDDGDIVVFRKDGVSIAKIATSGNDFKFYGSVSNIGGIQFGHSKMMPMKSGSLSNGGTDLGSSSYKWKDLYLSGNANVGDRLLVNGATSNAQLSVLGDASLRAQNVQVAVNGHTAIGFFNASGTDVGGISVSASGVAINLGGTAAANMLDDYEEGTWTPSGNGITFTTATGRYTKIGNIVRVGMYVAFPSTSDSGNAQIKGLPFTCSNLEAARAGLTVSWHNKSSSNGLAILTRNNDTFALFYLGDTFQTNANMSGVAAYIGGTYQTDS